MAIAAVGLLSGIAAFPAVGVAAAGDPLLQEDAGVVVNWRRGVVAATAGAAPDHRMPSAEVARAGAERRARSRARVRLGEALRKLPLGGGRKLEDAAVSRALERARAAEVDYQSNGGVVVTLEVSFGAWDPAASESPPSATSGRDAEGAAPSGPGSAAGDAPLEVDGPPPLTVVVTEGRLGAAPVVVAGGREATPVAVRYGTGAPPPGGPRPLKGKIDRQGRLVVEGAGPAELAGRPLMIYVQKVLR